MKKLMVAVVMASIGGSVNGVSKELRSPKQAQLLQGLREYQSGFVQQVGGLQDRCRRRSFDERQQRALNKKQAALSAHHKARAARASNYLQRRYSV